AISRLAPGEYSFAHALHIKNTSPRSSNGNWLRAERVSIRSCVADMDKEIRTSTLSAILPGYVMNVVRDLESAGGNSVGLLIYDRWIYIEKLGHEFSLS
ncbi:hypothetical protein AVEN_190751-1, partial [Araneus ventricosus]